MHNNDADIASRQALANFVRTHRLRLTPASAGIVAGTRRRTPGLRREEVAQLAGISATWYTWIEQGRDVSVSPAALARLCKTLHLSPAERAYLFELAGKRDPLATAGDTMDAPYALAEAINAIASPAYLLDRLWQVRAWNKAASELFAGWLDKLAEDRSILRFMFLNPLAPILVQDWENRARRLLAEFRLEQGRHLDDPELNALIGDLRRRSPFFAAAWEEHIVIGREGGLRSFSHPTRGQLQFEQITFNLASRPEFKLVILVAAKPLE